MNAGELMKQALDLIATAKELSSKVDSVKEQTVRIEKHILDIFQRVATIEENQRMLPTVIESKCESMIYKKVLDVHEQMREDINTLQTRFEDYVKSHQKVTTIKK